MSRMPEVIAVLVALCLAILSLNDLAASKPPRFTLRNATLLLIAVALLAYCSIRVYYFLNSGAILESSISG